MSLKDKVIIVNLTISQWGARKYDATATREVEQIHSAFDAGRFNKVLIKSETLKNITTCAGKARQIHYDMTLPWGDNGDRILSTESYFTYITEIGKMVNEFNQLVETFVAEYQNLKYEAKNRLSTLYKDGDYPHESEIREKFGMKTIFMPVAESDDFRLKISDEVATLMRTEIESEVNSRVSKAIDSVVDRARDVVSRMYETLSDPDKTFRNTMIGNIESLVETIPLLNFNKDQKLVDLTAALKTLIVDDPDKLRLFPRFRSEMAQKAKNILDSL